MGAEAIVNKQEVDKFAGSARSFFLSVVASCCSTSIHGRGSWFSGVLLFGWPLSKKDSERNNTDLAMFVNGSVKSNVKNKIETLTDDSGNI